MVERYPLAYYRTQTALYQWARLESSPNSLLYGLFASSVVGVICLGTSHTRTGLESSLSVGMLGGQAVKTLLYLMIIWNVLHAFIIVTLVSVQILIIYILFHPPTFFFPKWIVPTVMNAMKPFSVSPLFNRG